MTNTPDVLLPNGHTKDMRPFVECTFNGCTTAHRIDQPFTWKPEQVYASLNEAGWTADPARCPDHLPDTYDLMSEDDRRAAVGYLIDQGRHLEDLPNSWTTEDAFQTTESLIEAYQSFIEPRQMGNVSCTCGNTRHPEPLSAYDLEVQQEQQA